MKETENIFYFELATEYGPLYIYKKYNGDLSYQSREIPETREFFTQEEAIIGYSDLAFLNGTSVFPTETRNMEGIITTSYLKPLSPYDFLMKVGAFLETKELRDKKRKDVYHIFEMKAKHLGNNKIITELPKVSEEQKNKMAKKILKPYLK